MMRIWFLLSVVCLSAFIGGGTCLGQDAKGQNPTTKVDQRDPNRICPTVSVSCPANPDLNQPFDFTATVSGGNPDVTPTYSWDVANGEIITGQGTPAIRVKPLANQTVTATVRIGGFDTICSRTASCSTVICHPNRPAPKRIDTYGHISYDQVRLKLDHFADALKNQPGAMGYIRFSRGKNETVAAQSAAENAKQYLYEKFEIEKDRIRVEDGGTQEEFMIELWLIPQGSYLPEIQPKGSTKN